MARTKIKNMKTLVFVYGSLKKDYHNHHWLEKGDFIGHGYLPNYLSMYTGELFPFVIKETNNDDLVEGELYEISLDDLKELDILENHPDLYKREKINVFLEQESEENGINIATDIMVSAWVYIFQHDVDKSRFEKFHIF